MPPVLIQVVQIIGVRRLVKIVVAAFAAQAVAWFILLPLAVGSLAASTADEETGQTATACAPDDPTGGVLFAVNTTTSTAPSPIGSQWDAEAVRNAQVIAARGAAAGVGQQGVVVALATAMQESVLRNLDYGDRDSLGLFQQRPSTGWGTPDQIRDPAMSADAFYGVAAHTSNPGLTDIPGWQSMSVTQAAQAVQRSAFPDAYARHEAAAAELASQVLSGVDITEVLCTGPAAVVSGEWAHPLAPARYNRGSPFGMRVHPITRVWRLHSGVDLSAPSGTEIRSVCAGVVTQTGSMGTGGLTTTVDCGGGVEAFYMHQSRIGVNVGDQLTAGQVLGLVGNTGGSTGSHLHLGVRVGGAPTDPVPFLATHGIRI